jgi:hypothetical protein
MTKMTPTTPSPISDQVDVSGAAIGEREAIIDIIEKAIKDASRGSDTYMAALVAADSIRARSTAPTTGSAPVAWLVTSKRGMVRVAWTEKPSEAQVQVCEFDGDTITPLYAAPASPAASDPMVIARLKESLRAESSTALTVTCWRSDLIALLAASMGGNKS